jgi:sulfate adenylyltransferase subunit 1
MDILRFITAGSVDDGKSTLIGRILYDTNNIKTDVLRSVSVDNSSAMNLAHITDGLRSEREQGITIDVAYKYFTTANRKYIITDAPGHFQYTKNLVTGASGVDAMIILIDARNGITEQTRRHSLVASFLRIDKVVIAINKMDAVGYEERQFAKIKDAYLQIAEKLQLKNVTFIPISALLGDNVSFPSEKMPWYAGQTMIQYLEHCEPVRPRTDMGRFSVQCVINNGGKIIPKGYAGKMLSGRFQVGDTVSLYSSAVNHAVISKIMHGYSEIQEATAGENISIYFEELNDLERGCIVSDLSFPPIYADEFDATICWLNTEHPMPTGHQYILRISSSETICTIEEVLSKTEVTSFEKYTDELPLAVNQFANVRIRTKDKIAYDTYASLRENGRGVIIDPDTNYTSGAFIIN